MLTPRGEISAPEDIRPFQVFGENKYPFVVNMEFNFTFLLIIDENECEIVYQVEPLTTVITLNL